MSFASRFALKQSTMRCQRVIVGTRTLASAACSSASAEVQPSQDSHVMSPVMEKVANIIKNVTDRQSAAKVLHFYPECDLLRHLGRSSHLELTGCHVTNTDDDSTNAFMDTARLATSVSSQENYREILSVDILKSQHLPFSPSSFRIVVNCIPPMRINEKIEAIAKEKSASVYTTLVARPSGLLQLTNENGYLILGMEERLFNAHDMPNSLMNGELASSGSQPLGFKALPLNWSLMSVQKVHTLPIITNGDHQESTTPVTPLYYIAVLRKTG